MYLREFENCRLFDSMIIAYLSVIYPNSKWVYFTLQSNTFSWLCEKERSEHFWCFLCCMKFLAVFAGCSGWNAAPGARPPSCSPKWWCGHVTWCSTCTVSRVRCATRPSIRATSSAWKTALCCVRSTTNSRSPRNVIIHPLQPPSLEAARTHLHFHPPSSTLITTTRRFRRPPRRSARTVSSVAKCPTSTALPQVQRGRKVAPGSGNQKTWRPWLPT